MTAQAALDKLKAGNQRFVQGEPNERLLNNPQRRRELVGQQKPFAVILGCADSRVPAEIIFSQGLGDLFVIRVAGNVADATNVGSVEYAVEQLGTRLVVVLGHSSCGAVQATLAELERPSEQLSPNIGAIVELIRPSVAPLLETDLRHDRDALLQHAVRANIQASVTRLRQSSNILENRIQHDGLLLVGAEYSLATGKVEFFDG